jgi:hypothetical protein
VISVADEIKPVSRAKSLSLTADAVTDETSKKAGNTVLGAHLFIVRYLVGFSKFTTCVSTGGDTGEGGLPF